MCSVRTRPTPLAPRERARVDVDLDLLGAGHARLTHLTRDDRGVAGHAAA
jgi:hypothetical protein